MIESKHISKERIYLKSSDKLISLINNIKKSTNNKILIQDLKKNKEYVLELSYEEFKNDQYTLRIEYNNTSKPYHKPSLKRVVSGKVPEVDSILIDIKLWYLDKDIINKIEFFENKDINHYNYKLQL